MNYPNNLSTSVTQPRMTMPAHYIPLLGTHHLPTCFHYVFYTTNESDGPDRQHAHTGKRHGCAVTALLGLAWSCGNTHGGQGTTTP